MSLIQGYINGTESGWLESKYPGLAKAQFDLLNSEGLFSTPLQTTNIPDHFSLHSVARKFLGKDVGGGVQQIGDCFPAGSMVRMADGTEKPIEDVQIGEEVITHLGRARPVTDRIKKPYKGELVTVKCKGAPREVTATPDHKFVQAIIRDGRGKAEYARTPIGELNVGDRLVMPYVMATKGYKPVIDLAGPDNEIVDGNWVKPLRGGKKVKRRIEVNEEFAQLVGLTLAEGSIGKHEIVLWLGSHESELIRWTAKAAESVFGIKPIVDFKSNSKSVTYVRINSNVLAKFFKELIPGNVYTKRVPPMFFSAPESIRLALLKGWMDGDGHLNAVKAGNGISTKVIGVSACANLLQDMFHIALSCGLKPSVNVRQKASHQRVASGCVALYGENCLRLYPEKRKSYEKDMTRGTWKTRSDMSELGFAPKITEIRREQVETTVYCLEVEEDHTLVVNSFTQNNCVSWGGKHASEYLQAVLGLLKARDVDFRSVFAPYYYGISRTYIGRGQLADNSDGSLGSWLAEAVQKFGTLFDDDEGVPAYSGAVTKRWGDRNSRDDLDKFVNIAKEFLVKSVAKINSWNELCAALANGYPCTVASMVGFEMQPDRQGYHRRRGQWAHQMMIFGYDNPRSCGYIANSWGDVHGRLKDFHSDDVLPVGTIRAPKDAIEHMIATGEVYTFGDMEGFKERSQDIEKAMFDLIGEK